MTMTRLIMQAVEKAISAGVDVRAWTEWGVAVVPGHGGPAFAAGWHIDPLGAILLTYDEDGKPLRCEGELPGRQLRAGHEMFLIEEFCKKCSMSLQWVLGFQVGFDGETPVRGMLYRSEREGYQEGFECGQSVKQLLPELIDALRTIDCILRS